MGMIPLLSLLSQFITLATLVLNLAMESFFLRLDAFFFFYPLHVKQPCCCYSSLIALYFHLSRALSRVCRTLYLGPVLLAMPNGQDRKPVGYFKIKV